MSVFLHSYLRIVYQSLTPLPALPFHKTLLVWCFKHCFAPFSPFAHKFMFMCIWTRFTSIYTRFLKYVFFFNFESLLWFNVLWPVLQTFHSGPEDSDGLDMFGGEGDDGIDDWHFYLLRLIPRYKLATRICSITNWLTTSECGASKKWTLTN